MTPLTLNDLSRNAFRILGLTADASQAQIDAAARKMRIWKNPAMIPASANDATWIGPIARSSQDLENAVARLTDPISRLQERFWWFCSRPPETDEPPKSDPKAIPAFHDAALIHLYRSLLTNAASDNVAEWQATIERFRILAESDDYLQWLFEAESAGDYEKRATLDEIAEAQGQILNRLSAAAIGTIDEALAGGDFAAAAQAIQLVRTSSTSSTDPFTDRMEDDLAARCQELADRVDKAWKTKRVAALRPACNHAISRFGTVIRPLIDELASATTDVDRQNRARMHGAKLLIHVAEAYEAFDNFMASQRTLETALELAANTPMESIIASLLEKAKPAAQRQKAGAPRGQRQQAPQRKEFKVIPGKMYGDTWRDWLAEVPLRYQVRGVLIIIGVITTLARVGCDMEHNAPVPSNPIPIYDSAHPPSVGLQK